MTAVQPPLIAALQRHAAAGALAIGDERCTHAELLTRSARTATRLLAGRADLHGARVCFMATPSFAYVDALLGILRAGGIAVPLCTSHPAPELLHVIDDCGATLLVCDAACEARLRPLAQARGVPLLRVGSAADPPSGPLPELTAERPALLIYTSGTTGKPKGALSTHASLQAQIEAVCAAWELASSDRILHVLPLHHLHGILNALLCVLAAGGCCELLPRFDAAAVVKRISDSRELTLFMAVPTIYAKLIARYEQLGAAEQRAFEQGCQRLRLMVSGSAALPVSVLSRFAAISGHTLLERYGMTELGMALGNPLHGERRAGTVGLPFPGVQARLVREDGTPATEGEPGDLEIRGPGVFREYWQKPEATASAFTTDGYFRTGDVAVVERGYHRLLGRQSVDILKTGGYKVSALEVEEALREHPAVAEVAVVGVPDEVFGQRVAAAIVVRDGHTLDLDALRAHGKARLASYKLPSLLRVVATLPRNAMGKVQKPEVAALWSPEP